MIIYYNPECSKCQEARELLESRQCEFSIRNYLQDAPTPEEIKALVNLLGCKAEDLVRKTETLFIENYAHKTLGEEEYIDLIAKHPVLLQRPIVIDGKKAVIGRPPSLVLQLVK